MIIGSENAACGLPDGGAILRSGGSALDAVEAATRVVEDNLEDHTVGSGGYPNLLGEVELDASIMDGTDRRAGAVGALQGFRHPISVARQVMERLPHVLLSGAGAARFAQEIGAEPAELLSIGAREAYAEQVVRHLGDPRTHLRELAELAKMAADPEHVTGTVNVLAIDRNARLASAVSTSGWAWKYPGRLGDSPVIGAGNYCDDRFGAACCTGYGELALRAGTARSVVAAMQAGLSVADACEKSLRDALGLVSSWGRLSRLNVVAIDKDGNHAGASTYDDISYVVIDDGGGGVVALPRALVSP